MDILARLFELQDEKYKDFQGGLIPGMDKENYIGVRTPKLRALAKELYKDHPDEAEAFLDTLPHKYFDENQLHGFIISLIKDYDKCMERTEAFLPYIDNWATCDQTSPKVFGKHKKELFSHIKKWIKSDRVYTVRFAVDMLMTHFLDDGFDAKYTDMVAGVKLDDYYVKMVVAWYFATALAKKYDEALPYIEGKRLEKWTHNKSIRKAIESYRVTPEHKEYLRSLVIK